MSNSRIRRYRKKEGSGAAPQNEEPPAASALHHSFETREMALNRRLKEMYPNVREKEHENYLPRCWDKNQASPYLEISKNGITVVFRKNAKLKDEKDPSAIVRANVPIPACTGFYYFEVKIKEGHRGCMGIGLSRREGQLNRMPGWDPLCYGYHGDDGNFFCASGQGIKYGPTFGTGDIIGCGVDTQRSEIFFTKNGKHLGVAYKSIELITDLYPTVGLKTPGEQVSVNFGHKPFSFDFEAHQKLIFRRKHAQIEATQLPDNHHQTMNKIVASYLAYSGSVDALRSFEQTTNLEPEEDYQFIKLRSEISKMVVDRYHGAKVETKLRENYPELLDSHPSVQVLLMCLRFIDVASTVSPSLPKSFQKNPVPGGIPPKLTTSFAVSSSSSAPPTVANSSCHTRNSNKRTRSKEDCRSSRKNDGLSPAKKSPVSARRLRQRDNSVDAKNGDTKVKRNDLANDELLVADHEIFTTSRMYNELSNDNDDLEKMKYLIKMGRQILAACSMFEPCATYRKIVEISLSTLHTHRKMSDHHPLNDAHLQFISNKVFEMISQHANKKPYSELRGLFLAWKGIQFDLSRKDYPAAAIRVSSHIGPSAQVEEGEAESDSHSDMSSTKELDEDEKMQSDDVLT